jgi:hypothetical protein
MGQKLSQKNGYNHISILDFSWGFFSHQSKKELD